MSIIRRELQKTERKILQWEILGIMDYVIT